MRIESGLYFISSCSKEFLRRIVIAYNKRKIGNYRRVPVTGPLTLKWADRSFAQVGFDAVISHVLDRLRLKRRGSERSARWQTKKNVFGSSIFELQRDVRRLEQEIENLNSIVAAEAAAEAQRNKNQERQEREKLEKEGMAKLRRQQQQQREKQQREAAEAMRKQQAEKRAAEQHRQEEEEAKIRREQYTHFDFTSGSTRRAYTSTCRHDGWWPKVQGRMACPECCESWTYLLQCPGCQMKAFPRCQASIRPKTPRNTAKTSRRAPPRVRTPGPDLGYDW
ncbi:uncharacterized protein A1O5_12730 [Cladophialophora psammophila CBS 110553]|uniref:Uncharacterized protein n=1 Tax=Cladophialophora psammophila CBS 110553 TaxID=1182543 RepID=W9VS47_9EURO|nr:uncharacterized protein A1O5_12730 [Cladophialophora psammophila CBS 110553]EXJ54991.1 hypothetical protein A1O5_12730 [Cladophialophora psammophila CBS 110553]